jgi:PAS domain S-box-containing protein
VSIDIPMTRRGTRTILGACFALTVLALTINCIVAVSNTYRLAGSNRRVLQTDATLALLERTLSKLKDAETGQRGYLLTGADSYLEPYRAALATVGGDLVRLRALTADNPDQRERIARLESRWAAKLAELQETIRVRKDHGPEAAVRVVLTNRGQELMKDIRRLAAEMEAAERAALSRRVAQSAVGLTQGIARLIASSAVGLLLVILFSTTVLYHLAVRQKDEQTLREQLERWQVTLASIADAVVTTDHEGRVTFLNAAAQALTGREPAEAIGQALDVIFPIINERTHERVENPVAKVLEQGTAVGLANHSALIVRSGRIVPIDDSAAPIRDRQGNILGVVLVIHEVTDPQKAARQLADTEARTRAILDAAVDAIITIDERGIVESINPAGERLFGYSGGEVIGQNIGLLMPEPYRSEHDGYLANYRATGRKKIIGSGRELVGRRKDGTTFPMDLAVCEVHLANRRLFAGSVRDITDRKRAEVQLRYYADELQERNAELLRSNQELDDFAYIASHDLKEPLRGIHSYTTFLIEDYGDKLDAEGRAKLETLKDLAQRMYALIDSLLEFSRVGRVDLAIQETDLNEVLGEVLESLRISIEEKGTRIRVPTPLPTIRCDRVRVAEVFRNLLTNAIKYNDKPEKWIEIGWHVESDPQLARRPDIRAGSKPSEIVLTVRDNGIGIQEKYFESIFRIFKRLHARDKFGGGTGVGLTIVKKIIERHGGRIWIESTHGEGTAVSFTLCGERGHVGDAASDPGRRG